MYIPIYKEIHTATVKLQGTKQVQCEQCGQEYFYQMERTGSGKGQALYGIGSAGAEERATRRAEANAQKKLDKEVEVVPCPRCHWMNQAMVKQYRKQMHYWLKVMAVLFGLGLPVTGLVLRAVGLSHGKNDEEASVLVPLCIVGGLILAVVTLSARYLLQQQFNPALNHPELPKIPKGSPLPMVHQAHPRTGRVYLVPVAYRNAAPQQVQQ